MSEGGWTIISNEDFRGGAGGWTPPVYSSCGGLGDILGGSDMFTLGTTARKTFDLEGRPHSQVRVSLDFIKIGEWDNEVAKVTLAGEEVFEQSYGASDGSSNECGSPAPELTETVNVARNHTGNDLTLEVTTSTSSDQDATEAFAIDNVILRIR
jgi:hypothetical protein